MSEEDHKARQNMLAENRIRGERRLSIIKDDFGDDDTIVGFFSREIIPLIKLIVKKEGSK